MLLPKALMFIQKVSFENEIPLLRKEGWLTAGETGWSCSDLRMGDPPVGGSGGSF